MGYSIRGPSDDDQDTKEEFLVEYQEVTQLEIHEIQLEEGNRQDTANKSLCKHKKYAQTFPQCYTLLNSGQGFSGYPLPKLGEEPLVNQGKQFKSASGKITSIGTIIKEIIIPHRKGNITLNPELVVFEDSDIQGFLLGTDYQRMYVIDIYNSKTRQKKEEKFSLEIYQMSTHDPPEKLLNEFITENAEGK
ncbi:hypothetical protein O181_013778 [Austropuccinia psidii MF-1]|uniref:Uncharacterized protein n=1 Tax=Austropuccinia psidii MF-1 TaxID=1389203 RepID=A0A9Q3BZC7_9BASI|nr:hypothetical protein [Austropuccinia psidii MF-1]